MIPVWLASAILILQPVLDAPQDIRLASRSDDDHTIQWTLNGTPIANTTNGHATTIHLDAGSHQLHAEGPDQEDWTILARPEPPTHHNATYVEGWSAHHLAKATAPPLSSGHKPGDGIPQWLPILLLLTGLGVVAWELERKRRGTRQLETDDEAEPSA